MMGLDECEIWSLNYRIIKTFSILVTIELKIGIPINLVNSRIMNIIYNS